MEKYSGKAIASLVLGIISVLTFWTGNFALIGVVCGIVGMVFGIQIRKAGQNEGFKPDGISTAGLVLSIIGMALSLMGFLVCVACVGIIGTMSYM
ncbi:MAG: hypothetical protein AB7V37_04795 [Eubacteriaceae bacterium]